MAEEILTSKQYPNSTCSFSPGCINSPCAAPLLRPLVPLSPVREAARPLGPNIRPMRKYASVEMSSEVPMKCTKTKRRARRTMAPKEGAYATPHARAVRMRKKERR